MRSNKRLVTQTRLSLFMLALVFVGGLFITVMSKVEFYFYPLALVSAFLCFQLTGIIHELGHYLTAKENGFEVYYCAFPNFIFDKTAKKKLKFVLKGEYLGEIRFYPKEEGDYAEWFKYSLGGGIYAHSALAITLNVLLVISIFGGFGDFSPLLSVLLCYAPYSLYTLIVNAIPWFHPNNDGSMIKRLKKNPEEVDAINNFYTIQKALFDGKTYGEISEGYFKVDDSVSDGVKIPLLVCGLRRAIEVGESKKATKISETLTNTEFSDVATDCELLCKFISDKNEEKIKEYETVLSYAESENEPIVLRTLLVHAKYRGDETYLSVAKPTALKVCEQTEFCKGDVIYNKKLIERI